MIPLVEVPCNGCTACCRYQVLLDPSRGDDISSYEINEGPKGPSLKMVDGHCIYLKDGGCSIHDRAPATCRSFDCRLLYVDLPRSERRRGKATSDVNRDVLEAGRIRLGTLLSKTGPEGPVPVLRLRY